MINVIEKEIDARERAVTVLTPPQRQGRESPTAAVLMTGYTPQGCSYCRQNHSSSSCKVVTDVGLQKQILRKSGRCFVCLRKYHIRKDCRFSMRCPSLRSSQTLQLSTCPTQETPSRPPTEMATSSMYSIVRSAVLLQTARAVVFLALILVLIRQELKYVMW